MSQEDEARRVLGDLLDRGIQVWVTGTDLAFRAPKGAWSAELRAAVLAHKAALRDLVGREHKYAPASFAQERLWLVDQLEPGSAAYNMPEAVRLRGRVDPAALAAALAEIVRRHEVLRTTLRSVAGRPRQVVARRAGLTLPVVDLSGLDRGRRRAEARRQADEEVLRPFDLARGPLLRAALLCLDGPPGRPREAILLRTVHHAVADGVSEAVFQGELCRLCAGARLPEPPLQYADFAARQRRRLAGERLEEQLAWWREQLAGAPPPLELPADRPRAARRRGRGALHARALPAELAAALRRRSREAAASLFMTALAAFAALLGRSAGRRDVLVGTTTAGRGRQELEDLIGFFVNTLVMRVRLGGDPTFRELLGQVRETALEAFAHQDVPFEKLADELQPKDSRSATPFFRIVFQLHAGGGAFELPGLDVEPFELAIPPAKFDLVVNLSDAADGLASTWHYPPDLVDATTVRRLAGHFVTLLAAAAADPGEPVSALAWLSAAERHQLTTEWNGGTLTPDPSPRGRGESEAEESPPLPLGEGGWGVRAPLHELFEARVDAAPDAVAVTFEDRQLTYGELRRRAQRLAFRLRSLGVGRESRVALLLDRSPETVVAVIGTLAAGAAYVPLDTSSPPARLAFVLEDTGADVLVTRTKDLANLPGPTVARVVCLDDDRELPHRGPQTTPAATRPDATRPDAARPDAARPEDAAYVIYTSGSTGRPKGVTVTHANVTRLFASTRERLRFDDSDVWTLFHSYAFDFSVWELWGALAHGGRLVVVPQPTSRLPDAFHELACRQRVTVLSQTPSAFRLFMEADRTSGDLTAGLRLVIFGGEALAFPGLLPWIERHGDERPALVNMYGITETTVHVTWRRVRSADARRPRGRAIGRPLPGWRTHVVDDRLRTVAIGTPGEICVGGAGVARGYLARPALTAERFVPDPFAARSGARLYRSGDLARCLAGGDLEYLGRIDHQVQVRGFRVEPGEIEARLVRHPAVRAAAVVARQDAADVTLVAYVVPDGGHRPGLGELRSFLATDLPEPMLPSAVVVLEALPLTVNGKVDRAALGRAALGRAAPGRAALPAPESLRPELGSAYVAPRTELERFLAELWRATLEVARVGVDDDFFELGGNSIRGAVLINRLQQELGEIVHVVTIFDHPTVAAMASYLLDQHSGGVARRGVAPAPPPRAAAPAGRLDEDRVRQFTAAIPSPPPYPAGAAAKNPPAVFVLAPPRSGTTLLRVMLGGHPRLFAPPELELLSFHTLRERAAAFAGRFGFWREGLLRAVMAIRGASAGEAESLLERYEREGMTTQELYRRLQGWLGDRLLVDKTPSYAIDAATLERAEACFENPFYLHLVRHPCGAIHSFVEARLDQLLVRQPAAGFARRELAELHWLVSHRNVLRFLEGIPRHRRHRVVFEQLVKNPEPVLQGVCRFLGLDFAGAMTRPYEDPAARMTDGPHAASRMLGDVKFHQHSRVDAGVAERWRGHVAPESLSELTRELAAALGYRVGGALVAITPRRRGDEALPLSFSQQRLWFIHHLDPTSAAYNMPAAFELVGRIDVEVLERAFAAIARRHETLRTTFPSVDGQGRQRVAAAAAVTLPRLDLASLPAGVRRAAARRLVRREARRPFDLARGPVLRLALLRLGERRHILFINLHHIVSDGWSLGVLFGELTTLCRAFARGERARLPELPVQYADFAIWEREWLAGDALAAALAYWREQLAGLEPLATPTDRPRPALWRDAGSAHDFELASGVTAALERLSRERGVSLFMTLLAGFAALLQRWTGGRDVAVGSPIAHRNRREVEGLIGFFVNDLVLRLDLSGEPDFTDLLARARRVALEAYAHQDLPFEKLVDELAPERDASRHPLFQVALVLADTPRPELLIPGLEVRPLELEVPAVRFDLELFLSLADGRLDGSFVYSSDLFDATTVARLARHLANLLQAVAAEPALALGEVPLLAAAERHQLVAEWNDVPRPDDDGPGLHQLFEAQAARTPDAVAVAGGDQRLSYRELDRRANALARRLADLGVRPETRVGLCADPSPEMVVGIFAVLKAGGAYVPLDPSHPAARVATQLADAQAAVVLASPRLTARFSDLAVSLEPESDGDRPAVCIRPQSAAYVMYTSGSTGRPKGVVVSHRNVARSTRARAVYYRDAEGKAERFLLLSSIAFDSSIAGLFGTLCSGHTLWLVAEEARYDPAGLAALIVRQRISRLLCVPALYRLLLAELAAPSTDLATAIVAGEACPRDLVDRHAAALPRTALYNEYGPTEATVWCTVHRCDAATAAATVPIGGPVGDARIHLLRERLRLVAAGAPGELCVGGGGLARGYLGRPALTAAAFVPDPFGPQPGERLYQTGDLARWRADGTLEFLDRRDHQVKIHGYRVETEEIEAALRRHPDVRDAAVVARGGRLAAYVTAAERSRERWQAERVALWHEVYERLYSAGDAAPDPAFDVRGWRSSFTGRAIPPADMREWVEGAVSRILALAPRRVLEIGCGSGLVLWRVAPHAESYVGTDFSPPALATLQENLQQQLAQSGGWPARVRLMAQPADDFSGLGAAAFDTVVLNSVVQYFPGVEYLRRVLAGAVETAAPGGAVFVGDVRSLPLLDAWCAAVELRQAGASLSLDELRQRISRRRRREEELVVHPAFFVRLARRLPGVRRLRILPKGGRRRNELTQFRYDVIFDLGEPRAPAAGGPEVSRRDWRRQRLTGRELRQHLERHRPAALLVTAVPNARLARENRLLELLRRPADTATVADLKRRLPEGEDDGVDPAAWASLIADLPYRCELSWAAGRRDGSYDVLLWRSAPSRLAPAGGGASPTLQEPLRWALGALESEPAAALRQAALAAVADAGEPWRALANDPLREKAARRLEPRLREHLRRRLPEPMVPGSVVLLDALPLSPNGKVDRRALRRLEPGPPRRLLAGDGRPPRGATEEALAEIWARLLDLDGIGADDNFFALGGDSILAIRVVARARERGLWLTVKDLFQHQTVAELAALAESRSPAPARRAEQGLVTGPVPLTPIQRWFFERELPEPWHYNQSVLLATAAPLDPRRLERALAHLVRHHDALRLTFRRDGARWRQSIAGAGGEVPFSRLDLWRLDPPRRTDAVAQAAAELQGSLDGEAGPLLRAACFDPGRLFVVSHHLAVDRVSWPILLEDLERAYRRLAAGEPVELPAKTTSFKDWAERLVRHARSRELEQELAVWREILRGAARAPAGLPADSAGANTLASAATLSATLGREETRRLLRDLPAAHRTRVDEVLLTALVCALAGRTGRRSLLVELEGHGREEIFAGVDVSRTVGWFTITFPVFLDLEGVAGERESVAAIGEQLAAVPRRGIGYGLLRHLSADPSIVEKLRSLPQPQVRFNYLGQIEPLPKDSLFAFAAESAGPHSSRRGTRSHVLELNAAVIDGRLEVRWIYSRNLHRRSTIEGLAAAFAAELRRLIAGLL